MTHNNYELVEQVEADGGIPVSYYRNKRTGLKIFLANVECPIVKGDFCFATEAHDDDGIPHTLEHLIFMGSKKYPYKGVLDLLANRSFSNGTNAMTDTDNTNYLLRTAGSEGFLNLLPIYLDHLFFATLSDEAYMTEVHHINGQGEDAGVVYCEMQTSENTGDSLCSFELLRALYPGKCGYKSNTGGIMKNIRELLTNERIRKYHSEYYVPSNCCLVITGPVEPEKLFKALEPIDEACEKYFLNKKPIERPWMSQVPPLEESIIKTIEYPSDTNEDGIVKIGYRGPDGTLQHERLLAVSMLLEYLNQPTVSPLQRELIESSDPLCSNIDVCLVENKISYFEISFEAVDVTRLDKVKPKVDEILTGLLEGKEEFDLQLMNVILSKHIIATLFKCESNSHSIASNGGLGYFLYGEGSIKSRFQELKNLEELKKMDKTFWLGLISEYMLGEKSRFVCIQGKPSSELLKSMNEAEKKRIQVRKETLGAGLQKLELDLERAKKFINRPVPKEMLELPIPSVDSIKLLQTESKIMETSELPITVRLDYIKTNFVSVIVIVNTANCLTAQERLYVPLLVSMLNESPILRDGKLIDHQDVIKELYADTIDTHIGSSVGGIMQNLLQLNFTVEVRQYGKAIRWLNELLFKTKLTVDRIKTIGTRFLGDISQAKRDGKSILSATCDNLLYKVDSNPNAYNFIRQNGFLKALMKRVKSEPQLVEQEFERIRQLIVSDPKRILANVALDRKHFPNEDEILKPWHDFLPEQYRKSVMSEKSFTPSSIEPTYKLIDLGDNDNGNGNDNNGISGLLITNGSVESNFMKQFVPSLRDPNHPDLAKIHVLLKYFTQLEGPIWRLVRGPGLSYNYRMDLSTASGLMSLTISMSAQLVEAFKVMGQVVMGTIQGEEPLDRGLMESGKSVLIHDYISEEKNPSSKIGHSLLCYLRQLEPDFNKKMLNRIASVQLDDLKPIGCQYVMQLFQAPNRKSAVCCHPLREQKNLEGLNELGCNLKKKSIDSADFLRPIP